MESEQMKKIRKSIGFSALGLFTIYIVASIFFSTAFMVNGLIIIAFFMCLFVWLGMHFTNRFMKLSTSKYKWIFIPIGVVIGLFILMSVEQKKTAKRLEEQELAEKEQEKNRIENLYKNRERYEKINLNDPQHIINETTWVIESKLCDSLGGTSTWNKKDGYIASCTNVRFLRGKTLFYQDNTSAQAKEDLSLSGISGVNFIKKNNIHLSKDQLEFLEHQAKEEQEYKAFIENLIKLNEKAEIDSKYDTIRNRELQEYKKNYIRNH
jgi:hypothetical protein